MEITKARAEQILDKIDQYESKKLESKLFFLFSLEDLDIFRTLLKIAIDDPMHDKIEKLRNLVWEKDIASPTVPEYVEHHEDIQAILKFIDDELLGCKKPVKCCDNCVWARNVHDLKEIFRCIQPLSGCYNTDVTPLEHCERWKGVV